MIRVVTYNVNGALDPVAVGTVLARLEPDIVCMLEAPPRLTLRRVARVAGLHPVVRAGRRRLSTVVLVGERARVLSHARHELSAPAGVMPRPVAHAIVGVGALRLSVAAVQLGMRPDVREANAPELERVLADVDLPSVLGMDLNDSPKGPVAVRFAAVMQDAFAVSGRGRGDTYPTPDPSTRQDFCFVDPTLTVIMARVPTDPPVDVASHHRPLVVDVAASDEEPERRPDHAADAATHDPDPRAEPAA
jgi:endonuclease/exonuclease/phosphatase family metal-dependent hydrolase